MPSAGQSPAGPGPGRRLDREARLQKLQEGWVSSLGGCCLLVSWESLQRSGFMDGLSGCPHRAPKDGSVPCGAWVLSQSCQPGKVGSHGQWSGGCHWGQWRLAGPSWGERETGKQGRRRQHRARSKGPGGPTSLRTPGLRWLRDGHGGWPLKVRAKVSTGGAQL